MRRRTAQEPVEIDVLQKKKEELAQFVDRYNNGDWNRQQPRIT